MAGGSPPDLSKIVEEVPIDAPPGEPLALELQSFVRAVRGEESVAVSGRDGLEALRLAFRVLEAMGQSGQGGPSPRLAS
jgi:predicted dehydrogenase